MLSLNLSAGALSELQYADDLVLMSETIEGLMNKFLKWKGACRSKDLKLSFGKLCGSITTDGMSKSKVEQCMVCSLRVKGNSKVFKKFCMQKM